MRAIKSRSGPAGGDSCDSNSVNFFAANLPQTNSQTAVVGTRGSLRSSLVMPPRSRAGQTRAPVIAPRCPADADDWDPTPPKPSLAARVLGWCRRLARAVGAALAVASLAAIVYDVYSLRRAAKALDASADADDLDGARDFFNDALDRYQWSEVRDRRASSGVAALARLLRLPGVAVAPDRWAEIGDGLRERAASLRRLAARGRDTI